MELFHFCVLGFANPRKVALWKKSTVVGDTLEEIK